MAQNNKNAVAFGLFWSFGERITAQFVSMIVSIVLARLLTPEHYASIAIVTIFISVANTFVVAGFGNALIQKKNADELDFSTTLIFSLVLSVVFYFILFFCAPLIASYYNDDVLTPVLRVMSLRVMLAAGNSIQHAYVSKQMAFKRFFFSTLGGTVVSAIVGITMAYKGYGVWALVAQYLTNTTTDTIVLAFTSGWKPKLKYSFNRMKSLFLYGWKILVSELCGTLYAEVQGLVLSTVFRPVELSYYERGAQYPNIFINNIEASMHKVLFQKLSDEQDDLNKVKIITRQTIIYSTFLLNPVFFGLAACGDTITRILLTEKWLPCVPYIQILCLTDTIHPIFSAHTRVMKALGDSKKFMFITFFRYSAGFSFILLSIKWIKDPHIVIISACVALVITIFLCALSSRKTIGYSLNEQFNDIFTPLIISSVMFAVVILIEKLNLPNGLLLLFQVVSGCCVYISLSYFFNRKVFLSILIAAKKFLIERE